MKSISKKHLIAATGAIMLLIASGASAQHAINDRIWSNANNGGVFFDSSQKFFIGKNTALGPDHFGIWTNGKAWDALSINQSNGYVGIGLQDPQHLLHLRGGAVRYDLPGKFSLGQQDQDEFCWQQQRLLHDGPDTRQ